jgi:negative regulator of flagellin synthesis FlgM
MKVVPLDPKLTAPTAGGERPAAAPQAAAAQAAAAQEPSAKVELSAAAASALRDGGDFDAEKVQRIAQAIRDGQYRIDPGAIADKLIANARELLDRPSN